MQGVTFYFHIEDFFKSFKVGQITGKGVLRVKHTKKSDFCKFQSDWTTLEKVIQLFLPFSHKSRSKVSRA